MYITKYKEINPKRLHIALFQVSKIVEKTKLCRQQKDESVPGIGGGVGERG